MEDNVKHLTELFESLKQDLIKGQSDKGLKASGKSASLLNVYVYDTGIKAQLIDESGSFATQETGRKGGKGPKGFSNIIYEWLKYKKYGLNWKTDRERKTLSFLIARKIRLKGTFTHIDNRPTHVLGDILRSARIDSFAKLMADNVTTKVLSDLKFVITREK